MSTSKRLTRNSTNKANLNTAGNNQNTAANNQNTAGNNQNTAANNQNTANNQISDSNAAPTSISKIDYNNRYWKSNVRVTLYPKCLALPASKEIEQNEEHYFSFTLQRKSEDESKFTVTIGDRIQFYDDKQELQNGVFLEILCSQVRSSKYTISVLQYDDEDTLDLNPARISYTEIHSQSIQPISDTLSNAFTEWISEKRNAHFKIWFASRDGFPRANCREHLNLLEKSIILLASEKDILLTETQINAILGITNEKETVNAPSTTEIPTQPLKQKSQKRTTAAPSWSKLPKKPKIETATESGYKLDGRTYSDVDALIEYAERKFDDLQNLIKQLEIKVAHQTGKIGCLEDMTTNLNKIIDGFLKK